MSKINFTIYYWDGDSIDQEVIEVPLDSLSTEADGQNTIISAPTIKPYVIPLGVKPEKIEIEFGIKSDKTWYFENLDYDSPLVVNSSDFIELDPQYKYYINDSDVIIEGGTSEDTIKLTLITTFESVLMKGWELHAEYRLDDDAKNPVYPITKVQIEKYISDINKARIEIVISKRQRQLALIPFKRRPEGTHPAYGGAGGNVKYRIKFDDEDVFVGILDSIEGENRNRMTLLLKETMNELKFIYVANVSERQLATALSIHGEYIYRTVMPYKVQIPVTYQFTPEVDWNLYGYVKTIMNKFRSGWRIGDANINKDFFGYGLHESPIFETPLLPILVENAPILNTLQFFLKDHVGLDFWGNLNGENKIYYIVDKVENMDSATYFERYNRYYYTDFEYYSVLRNLDEFYETVDRVFVFSHDNKRWGDSKGFTHVNPERPPYIGNMLIFKSKEGFEPRKFIGESEVDEYKKDYIIYSMYIGGELRYMIADYTGFAEQIAEKLGQMRETIVLKCKLSTERYTQPDRLKWNINEGDIINFKYKRNPHRKEITEETLMVNMVKIDDYHIEIELINRRNTFFDMVDRKLQEIHQGNVRYPSESSASVGGGLLARNP